MSATRRWAAPALLLVLSALALPLAAARAADEPPSLTAKDVDALVHKTLRGVIDEGADMYNGTGKYTERDYLGCYHLYEGALIAVRPMLSAHADLQKAIDEGLDNARNTPDPTRRAFVLRAVIDQVRAATKPGGTAVPPPVVKETTMLGKVIDVAKDKLTVTAEGKAHDFVVSADTKVTIDGKDVAASAIKFGATVTVHAKGDVAVSVDAVNPAAPPPKVAIVEGKVVGVDKDRLTVSVDGKAKEFTVPADAKVTVDEKEGKLADLKKDGTAKVTTRNDVVTVVEATNPVPPPPPPPTEKKVTGKVTKVEKGKLTVKDEAGKETIFTVPEDARVTLDGKAGKLDDVKADDTVTVTDKDGKITVDAKAATPPPPPPPPSGNTLWDRLGGEKAVAKVVDDFVNSAGKDPKVNFWRDPTHTPSAEEVATVKQQLIEFISSATGGPLKYTGKDMKTLHKSMKITDAEFDAGVADLKAALEKNGVKGDDEKALLDIVQSTRKDIVESKGAGGATPKPSEDQPAETGTVEGKVTYLGKPLAGGAVSLVGADGKNQSAPIGADGTYEIDKVKAGEYVVTVETESVKPKTPGDNPKPPDATKPGDKPAFVKIPPKYSDPKTSGLRTTVRKGDNIYDIQLTD